MAEPFAILRIAKLKTIGNIAAAIAHNERKMEVPNADPSADFFVDDDYHASAEEISDELSKMKVRKNAVLAHHVVLTASPEFFKNAEAEEIQAFAAAAEEFLKQEWGKENIKNLTLHLDESTPHLHAICLPVINGKLNAKHITGDRTKMKGLQDRFHAKVSSMGLRRGISRSTRVSHKSVRQWYAEMAAAQGIALPEPRKTGFAGRSESATEYLQRQDVKMIIAGLQRTIICQRDATLEAAKLRDTVRQQTDEINKIKASEAALKATLQRTKAESERQAWSRACQRNQSVNNQAPAPGR